VFVGDGEEYQTDFPLLFQEPSAVAEFDKGALEVRPIFFIVAIVLAEQIR